MSVQTALQFLTTRVITTPALSQQFLTRINGKTEAEAAQAASDFGREHGVAFSAADATEARRIALATLAQAKPKAGNTAVELSPDDLEKVAGGITGGFMPSPYQGSVYTSGATTAASVAIGGGPGPGTAASIAINSLNNAHQQGDSPVSGNDVVNHVFNQIGDNLTTNFTTSNSIFFQW